MSKHTQEQWEVAEGTNNFIYALGPNGGNKFWFSVSSAGTDRISKEEMDANVRLIVSAPDLLAALQAAINCRMVPVSSVREGGAVAHSEQARVADQIRDAVAKATGAA